MEDTKDVQPPLGLTDLPEGDCVVLERFDGFVDCIDCGRAFVTLRSKHGDELIGEYPAVELERLGIRERRRFICETVRVQTGEIEIWLTKIPDVEMTDAEEAAIKHGIVSVLF